MEIVSDSKAEPQTKDRTRLLIAAVGGGGAVTVLATAAIDRKLSRRRAEKARRSRRNRKEVDPKNSSETDQALSETFRGLKSESDSGDAPFSLPPEDGPVKHGPAPLPDGSAMVGASVTASASKG